MRAPLRPSPAAGGAGHGGGIAAGPGPAGPGELASALGALNAAHANPAALASPAPTSGVGRIAA
ncbi:MAG: hypothetical protein M0002_03095 [Rhodospirillales bacterium]|nr:hypothetical protein [Rhodospirillales bacterium]